MGVGAWRRLLPSACGLRCLAAGLICPSLAVGGAIISDRFLKSVASDASDVRFPSWRADIFVTGLDCNLMRWLVASKTQHSDVLSRQALHRRRRARRTAYTFGGGALLHHESHRFAGFGSERCGASEFVVLIASTSHIARATAHDRKAVLKPFLVVGHLRNGGYLRHRRSPGADALCP